MIEIISDWFIAQGLPEAYLQEVQTFSGLCLIVVISWLGYYLSRHQLLIGLQSWVKKSKNTWDDSLLDQKVFHHAALLIPYLIILSLTPTLFDPSSVFHYGLTLLAKIAICFQVAQCLCAFLNVFNNLYKENAKEKHLPLSSTIQVLKLIIYLVTSILIIAFILNRSPIYLLSGLGALTAVLLLIFQDTIKGLVASIQISANKMVAPGDWVELPDYGADGDVLEIGLNTVKIQNFDKTITTVPTYALTSGSFKNWRDMFQSGGRRIKRSIIIDITSIIFYNPEELARLAKITLLQPYLHQKKQEISEQKHVDNVNKRQLTNIGTFRAYITAYLQEHSKVNQQMTCMVRQLAATDSGLPLELYFFSNDPNWINYEGIQADIFDHLYALAPSFNLRIFQHPTGHDWQKSSSTMSVDV